MINVTQCNRCKRVKQFGHFVFLDVSTMIKIQRAKPIQIVEEACPDCISGKEVIDIVSPA